MYFYDKDLEKKEEEPRISVGSYGNGGFSLKNLRVEEIDILEGMINEQHWVAVTDGRLETVGRRRGLPGPAEDEELLPFWRRRVQGNYQLELFKIPIPRHSSPSIIIEHLCGYNYTPDNYKFQAELLESYGFECLRSRRGVDGRFSETWKLYSLWHAKGLLKEMLKGIKQDSKSLDRTIEFLCRNCSFGTLDVAFQRAAMPIPD